MICIDYWDSRFAPCSQAESTPSPATVNAHRWVTDATIYINYQTTARSIKSMLEKPELKDEQIINCLRNKYGLNVEKISFLPLGADVNSFAYRIAAKDGTNYFLKLRKGDFFNETSVVIPNFLSAIGIKQVIPPHKTQTGKLWANINPFKVVLYPFVEGCAGLDIKMSKQQWFEFGAALKRFHAAEKPAHVTSGIQKDNFFSRWRDTVKMYIDRAEKETFNDHVKIEAAEFLKSKKDETLGIVKCAEQLAQMLLEQHPEFILCHSDIHGYNLLIDNNGTLYIVDWDSLIFAPKERDLMFIGGGHGDSGYTPQEEETMFYQGYGRTNVNQIAIAYYRYERIITDIADDCDLIFFSSEGEENKAAALEDLKNKFSPNSYIEIAYQSDKVLKNN
jgi:spectinomycin phosphotransferase